MNFFLHYLKTCSHFQKNDRIFQILFRISKNLPFPNFHLFSLIFFYQKKFVNQYFLFEILINVPISKILFIKFKKCSGTSKNTCFSKKRKFKKCSCFSKILYLQNCSQIEKCSCFQKKSQIEKLFSFFKNVHLFKKNRELSKMFTFLN